MVWRLSLSYLLLRLILGAVLDRLGGDGDVALVGIDGWNDFLDFSTAGSYWYWGRWGSGTRVNVQDR